MQATSDPIFQSVNNLSQLDRLKLRKLSFYFKNKQILKYTLCCKKLPSTSVSAI